MDNKTKYKSCQGGGIQNNTEKGRYDTEDEIPHKIFSELLFCFGSSQLSQSIL